ncbi:MAG: hypothetical protein HY331_07575, partial [Chloroflexi bacterium]|nr:hypothetical protein [Chloroflexota bacterium]
MRAIRVGTLQWAVGTFCGMIGSLMLIAPHQFSSPIYAAIWPQLPWWGAVFLVAGVALPSVATFAPHRSLTIAVHLFVGAVLLLLARGFVLTGGWMGAVHYSVLGLGTAV